MDIFVGIPAGAAHLTLLIAKGSSGDKIQAIIRDTEMQLKPTLPLVFQILPEIHMFGHKGDIPVHKVIMFDNDIHETISAFYRTHYKQTPGETPRPEWEPHVSVDGEEKKKAVDAILKDTHGIFIARTIYVKQIGGEKRELCRFEK